MKRKTFQGRRKLRFRAQRKALAEKKDIEEKGFVFSKWDMKIPSGAPNTEVCILRCCSSMFGTNISQDFYECPPY